MDREKFRKMKRTDPLRITGVIIAVIGLLLAFLLRRRGIGLVILIVGIIIIILARRKIKANLGS